MLLRPSAGLPEAVNITAMFILPDEAALRACHSGWRGGATILNPANFVGVMVTANIDRTPGAWPVHLHTPL